MIAPSAMRHQLQETRATLLTSERETKMSNNTVYRRAREEERAARLFVRKIEERGTSTALLVANERLTIARARTIAARRSIERATFQPMDATMLD